MLPAIRPKQTPAEEPSQPHPAASDGRRRRQSTHTRRNTVVAVACQPCQRRKHKCDGERPTCRPCLSRNRSDCTYDADGDQRRTSALKSRIEALSNQVQDLKDIIAGIAVDPNVQNACTVARQLVANGFINSADLAHACRTQQYPATAAAATEVPPQEGQKAAPLPSLNFGAIDPELLSSSMPIDAGLGAATWHPSASWAFADRGDFVLSQTELGGIPIDPAVCVSADTRPEHLSDTPTYAQLAQRQNSQHDESPGYSTVGAAPDDMFPAQQGCPC